MLIYCLSCVGISFIDDSKCELSDCSFAFVFCKDDFIPIKLSFIAALVVEIWELIGSKPGLLFGVVAKNLSRSNIYCDNFWIKLLRLGSAMLKLDGIFSGFKGELI